MLDRNSIITPESFEEIERYLTAQMPVEEQADFEKRLASDDALKSMLYQVQLLMTGIKESALVETLSHIHEALPDEKYTPVKKAKLVTFRRLLAAASVLLIFAFGTWWFTLKKSNTDKLYAEYFRPDPGLITAMSSSDNYVFDKAMVDYKTGKYKDAINSWKRLQQTNPGSDTLNYFIGTALLANGESGEAIAYLKKVTLVEKGYFQKDAYWYTGLALINQNKLGEATEYLRQSDRPEKEILIQRLK